MEKCKTQEEWKKKVQEKTVFLFTAPWCSDCRYLETALPEIEAAYPQWNFVEVNADDFLPQMQTLGILGIPSFVAYDRGEEKGRFCGRQRKTKEEVLHFLATLKA